MAQVTELTSLEDYHAELKKPGVVVVDFYSTQCPPCKASYIEKPGKTSSLLTMATMQVVAPLYEKIASKPTNSAVRFFKVSRSSSYPPQRYILRISRFRTCYSRLYLFTS